MCISVYGCDEEDANSMQVATTTAIIVCFSCNGMLTDKLSKQKTEDDLNGNADDVCDIPGDDGDDDDDDWCIPASPNGLIKIRF